MTCLCAHHQHEEKPTFRPSPPGDCMIVSDLTFHESALSAVTPQCHDTLPHIQNRRHDSRPPGRSRWVAAVFVLQVEEGQVGREEGEERGDAQPSTLDSITSQGCTTNDVLREPVA